ncbi:Putative lipoyltransferase 2, mitochondrial [Chamberlinius hualienensis]
MGHLVRLKNLGRLNYASALAVQNQLVENHLKRISAEKDIVKKNTEILDTLLIVEHPPVYTIGIRTKGYDASEEQRLSELGAEFYKTNRGGLITFHGPGQLVAYPILNLENFSKKSVKWYVCALQNCLIKTCQEFGVDAATCEHTGVWVKDNKIAAIGISCRRHITAHGIALNCNVDLNWFRHIVPCGIPDRGVTSLSSESAEIITVARTLPKFIAAFQEVFQCQLISN